MRRRGGEPRSQEVSGSGCNGQRLPWCSLEPLLALGPAGLEISQLLGGDIGVDSREPGMEVSETTLTEKWSAGFRGRSNERESRDAGPTLSPLHRMTVGSKSPALLGLSLVIHKMGLIIHYLPCNPLPTLQDGWKDE